MITWVIYLRLMSQSFQNMYMYLIGKSSRIPDTLHLYVSSTYFPLSSECKLIFAVFWFYAMCNHIGTAYKNCSNHFVRLKKKVHGIWTQLPTPPPQSHCINWFKLNEKIFILIKCRWKNNKKSIKYIGVFFPHVQLLRFSPWSE